MSQILSNLMENKEVVINLIERKWVLNSLFELYQENYFLDYSDNLLLCI